MPEVGSTYRVQLNRAFTFEDAAAIVPFLAALGITHLYCSPYLQARGGSLHGYDVTDHGRLNEELGGAPGHRALTDALARHGMGHILDVVPNHMAIAGRHNRWWWDVLKHGRASRYAAYFDIDWDPPEPKLHGKILMPVLGDHYGRVLAAGDIRIERDGGEVIVRYMDHLFPTSPESSARYAEATPDVVRTLDSDMDAVHELLERQHYRLAFWKTAGREVDYRRFFAVNDLVALRMDLPEVFEEVHAFALDLAARGKVDGYRIDHIDGLRDPGGYLRRLRSRAPSAYLIVEKILEADESLPSAWPVEGTTGYDFLQRALALFVDPSGEHRMTRAYEEFTGFDRDPVRIRRDCKVDLLRTELGSDLERLTKLFVEVCEDHLRFRDYTRQELRAALEETIVSFPVYRTYVDVGGGDGTDEDAHYVEEAIATAKERRDDLDPELFDFLHDILLLEHQGLLEQSLAMRFQQTTGPVMAKGVEDTFFYVYNRLCCLNDVGGDPLVFGGSVEEFHRRNRRAQERWPRSMLTTSTHDTKRSEDVRARIALLSEVPDDWDAAIRRWSEMNERHRVNGMPDRNMEYLFYQTLVGAWPLSVERAAAYMEKASKEAKQHTSWIDPAPGYDRALHRFVEATLADDGFVSDVAAFVQPLVEPGWITALAQALLKLTAPGVPDVYQGTELWDFSLVDPDNRRPVDYDLRRELLAEVRDAPAEETWTRAADGGPKLYLMARTLDVRRRFPGAFDQKSTYRPIEATGGKAGHVVAYARGPREGEDEVVVVVPRLVLGIGRAWGGGILDVEAQRAWVDWGDTQVTWGDHGGAEWTNELTGEGFTHSGLASSLFERFPVALLTRDAAAEATGGAAVTEVFAANEMG